MTDLGLPTDAHESEGPENDGFFTDLMNTKPYVKCAFEGFMGSGKTYTMIQVAIGLHRYVKSTKKVVYVDTEDAAKFAIPAFAAAGIGVHVRPTRSPADLIKAMRRVRSGLSDILIADSMTH